MKPQAADTRMLTKPGGATTSFFAPVLQVLRRKEFWYLWTPQYIVFLALLFFYTYGFMSMPSICILSSVILMMSSGVLWVIKSEAKVLLPLSMILPIAVIAGSVGGLYIYDVYAVYPSFYENSRVYADVVPSQPSAAVADAGKLVFSGSSFVDRNHSTSYTTERGSIYCVAPVRDPTQGPKVEFWAVGIDCCSIEGSTRDFTCDAAKNKDAHGGIVVFDNNNFFANSRFDEYTLARKKAEATFKLLSTPEPTYVRWVKEDNLDMLKHEYETKTVCTLLAWIFLYMLLSAGLVFAINRPKTAAGAEREAAKAAGQGYGAAA
eukprot:TRINITY_DN23841_c0_g4_i1.p1 TRINITY_DN23841_c0_g4~~TRINITY_DN23841_c0_g4_i1.p1  ORF type:complete len:320 (-),score=56.25 TRINITY_DN23841_c0_g4_i1:61-1020(-)